MFKKIASLVLTAALLVSTAAFTTSAAETNEDVAVAADQASEVGAENSTAVGSGKVLYFDVKSAGWNTAKSIFCHVWRADGTGDWPAWSTKAEKCTYDKESGIATYDIETAIKRGYKMDIDDTKSYCVIFAADTGAQTYNAIMSGKCFGDTLYCESSEQVENPQDSQKKCYIAVWKNNKDCGPQKIITSSGQIVGNALAEGTTDVTLVADYLISYYNDQAKLDSLQNIINKLKVSPSAVMEAAANKEAAAVKSGSKKQADVDKELKAITTAVSKCTDPTKGGEKVDQKDIEKAKDQGTQSGKNGQSAATISNTGGSTSSASSSGSSSGSSSSSTSSSGSNSVNSGQETTIFFVFGGLMVAAAGLMFLARKKREY